MVSVIKTFSFKPSDLKTFEKVQKILAKSQNKSMSKLVMRLLNEYVKKHESALPKKKPKSVKFFTVENFQEKCPIFFDNEKNWKKYLERLEESEHHSFELHLQKIMDSFHSRSRDNSVKHSIPCPNFFSSEDDWKRYSDSLNQKESDIFRVHLDKILEKSTERGHEIYKEMGLVLDE